MMSLVLSFAVLIASAMANFQANTGADITCAVYNEEAKCWGKNNNGQLGLGDTDDRWVPEESPLDLGTDRSGAQFVPSTIGCGELHCCALSTGQQLKCWGKYQFAGLYGDADFGDFTEWTGDTAFYGDEEGEMALLMPFAHISNVVDMAVLESRTCVLEDHEGAHDIVCVGYDSAENGIPLDDGIDLEVDAPGVNSWNEVKLGGGTQTLCVFDPTTADTLKCWGFKVDVDATVVGGLVLQSVKCGNNHCCALTAGASLVCWGDDWDGSTDTSTLDDISDFGDVLDFSVSHYSTCALSTNGKVACFGHNGNNQGNQLFGTTDSYFEISDKFTQSGVRFADANSAMADFHYCLYEETDVLELQCWGYNSHGQLGYDSESGYTPNDAGNSPSVDLKWTVVPDALTDLTWEGWGGRDLPECAGDCDKDSHCAPGLYCYHNAGDGENGPPPGCTGTAFTENADYCFKVPASTGELVWFSWFQTGGLNACQGDCDGDDDCSDGLECFHNAGKKDVLVPGCDGTPTNSEDYCYNPNWVQNNAAGGFASGHSDDEPVEDMEPDHAASDEEAVNFNDFIMMMVGAAIGAMVVAGIVAFAVLMKRKRSGKKEEAEMAKAVHVPEASPASADGVETI